MTESTPVRIQRRRVKGWKMPPNTVSVTRPGKWGNPYRVGDPVFNPITGHRRRNGMTPVEAVERFRRDCKVRSGEIIHFLRGKNLACFCRIDQPCHADVLLVIANTEITKEK